MPEAYDIHDALFIQQLQFVSAPNALSIDTGAGRVPAGKVWTILSAAGVPSVAETQTVFFSIYHDGSTMNYPVTNPTSIALGPTYPLPLVREGMELKIFPNERLCFYRNAATAGSTLTLWVRFIETDIQYYVELDKHKVLRRRQRAMEITSPTSARGGGGGYGGGGESGGGESGGGGGRGLPI